MRITKNTYDGNKELFTLKSRLERVIALECGDGKASQALQTILKEFAGTLDKIENKEFEWSNAFDAVHDPIFIHDQNYRIVRANTAYAQKAGMKIQDVIGKIYWEVFPKKDGPSPQCAKLHEHHNHTSQCEEVKLDNGEVYLSRGNAVPDSQGRFLYSVHIMEDITESRDCNPILKRAPRVIKVCSKTHPMPFFSPMPKPACYLMPTLQLNV